MPQGITIAAFVLGSVFLLLALVGGGFKIFGAEISGKIGPLARAVAGVLGSILVLGGLLHWFDPRIEPQPENEHRQNVGANENKSDPAPPPQNQLKEKVAGKPAEEIVDVSGNWADGIGTEFSITQVGESFTFRSVNPYNRTSSNGSGTIRGHRFTSSFQTSIPSVGRGSGTISEDGHTISGNFYDSSVGQYTLTLVKR